jgi:hypothetical protein
MTIAQMIIEMDYTGLTALLHKDCFENQSFKDKQIIKNCYLFVYQEIIETGNEEMLNKFIDMNSMLLYYGFAKCLNEGNNEFISKLFNVGFIKPILIQWIPFIVVKNKLGAFFDNFFRDNINQYLDYSKWYQYDYYPIECFIEDLAFNEMVSIDFFDERIDTALETGISNIHHESKRLVELFKDTRKALRNNR